jgi:steroid delta-isomerase-like uncharacterized protein
MRMTRADMKRLQEEHVAAETRKDLAGAMAGYLEDCYYQNVPLGFRIQGREHVAAYYQRTWTALPDGAVTVEGEAFGAHVVVHWGTFRSTFRGGLLGSSPTLRTLEFPVIAVLTFRDGKIRAEHLAFDLATFCDQAGVSIEDARSAPLHGDRTPMVWRDEFVAASDPRSP